MGAVQTLFASGARAYERLLPRALAVSAQSLLTYCCVECLGELEGGLIISVIGSSEPTAAVASLAEQVGEELGRRGVTVVCGGLGGIMEAACRGAKSVGGTTIGIIPGSDPASANPWVDIPICTGLSHARNVIVVKTGRVAIAVGGGFGTLSEIGHALAEDIPVIGLRTWRIAPDGGGVDRAIIVARDARDAVQRAIEAAEAQSRPSPRPARGLSN